MSLKHQLTTQVKLLQKAAIIRTQEGEVQVLLLKRSPDALSRPNCWDLPGGNSEWPATDQLSAADLHLADLAREVEEETALQVVPSAFQLDQLTHFSTFFDADKQIFTIIAGWAIDFAKTDQNEIQISSEHQDFAWVRASEFEQYDFGGDKGFFVVDIVKNAFSKFS